MAKRITKVRFCEGTNDGRPDMTYLHGADGPAHRELIDGFVNKEWAKVIADTLGVPLEIIEAVEPEPETEKESSLF